METQAVMGRPKKPARDMVTVKIDRDLYDMARFIVGAEGVDLADVLADSMRNGVAIKPRYEKAVHQHYQRLKKPKN